MDIKIEKSVPVPENPRRKYPWKELKVGDSFVAPLATQSGASGAARRLGIVLVTRRIDADHVRIWRRA
jgi:hypothetical protein